MRDRTASLSLIAGLLATAVPLARGAAAQEAPAIDPCAILTAADIKAVVGEAATFTPRPRRTDSGTMQAFTCTHRTPGWTVALQIERGRTAEEVDGYLKTLDTGALTPVPGLGDRAWWRAINPTKGILHVVRGTDIVRLQTNGTAENAGALEQTRLLMRAALSRYAPTP